jgi:hypothetical protein
MQSNSQYVNDSNFISLVGKDANGSNIKVSIDNSVLNSIIKKHTSSKYIPKWVYWVWLISIALLSISLIIFFCVVSPNVNWNVEVVSVSIVLGFVGILATIVVINNHSQVREAKDDFSIKVSDLGKKIDEREKDFDDRMKCAIDDFEHRLNEKEREIRSTFKISIDKIRQEVQFLAFSAHCDVGNYDAAVMQAMIIIHQSSVDDANNRIIPFIIKSFNNMHFAISNTAKSNFNSISDIFASEGKNIGELKKIIDEATTTQE